LPGLTPQVGLARLAALNDAELGQARVPMQSINLRKNFLAKKMDARVKPAHDRLESRPWTLRPLPQRGRKFRGWPPTGSRRGIVLELNAEHS